MSKVLSKYLLVAVLLLSGIVYIQYRRNVHLANERDRYQANNTALLSEVRRMRIDSTTLAVDTKGLRLTVEEYKRFRAQDAETIKKTWGEDQESRSGRQTSVGGRWTNRCSRKGYRHYTRYRSVAPSKSGDDYPAHPTYRND